MHRLYRGPVAIRRFLVRRHELKEEMVEME